MKQYVLEAVIEGEAKRINKVFSSRREALNYFFDYFMNYGAYTFVINEEYCIGNDKHNIEYVYDYSNRFRIARK